MKSLPKNDGLTTDYLLHAICMPKINLVDRADHSIFNSILVQDSIPE